MNKSAVPIKFYECPWLTFDEAIDPCDKPLYDWLVSIAPRRPAWTPQRVKEIEIYSDTMQAIVDEHARCEAGKFAPPAPAPAGVSIAVSARLDSGGGSGGEAEEGLRSSVTVDFSPPPPGCGSIPFHILNVPAVGGSYHPENTVFEEVSTTTPPKNGTGNFANAVVFDLVNASTEWRKHIHQVFTTGTWRLRSPKVFAHYAEWSPAGDPEPSAELLARGEAFDGSRLVFDMPDFPGMGNPRWLVIHRYRHQQSGRYFYLSEWMTQATIQSATWPTAPYGRGFQGVVAWSDFEAPDDGDPAFFDPEGTWVRQSGVLDFAMTGVQVLTKYSGALCEETFRTISPLSFPDMMAAAFLSQEAYWEEEVEVRTIRQYKACYRIVSVTGVACIAYVLKIKLLNQFNFPACVIARLPFGYGAKGPQNQPISYTTVVAVRNLSANSESGEIEIIIPSNYAWAIEESYYTIQSVIDDAANNADGAIADHGFICNHGQYADGAYISAIKSTVNASSATATQKAVMHAFYSQGGVRHWTSGAITESDLSAIVFSYAMEAVPLASPNIAGGFGADFLLSYDLEDYAGNLQHYTYSFWNSLSQAEAVAMYGRVITVSAAAAQRTTSNGYQGGIIFTSWSGGDSGGLAQYLLADLQASMSTDPYYQHLFSVALNVEWTITIYPAVSFANSGPHYAASDYPGGTGELPAVQSPFGGSYGLFVTDSFNENAIQLVAI